MADITYTVNQDDPNSIQGFEQFSQADKSLVNSYTINSSFNSSKNTVELNILSLADELIETIPGYANYRLLGNAQSAGNEGASIVTINPVEDCKVYGYETGGVKLLYHFLNDLYSKDKTSTQHYIDSISPDRTELRLVSLELSDQEVIDYTTAVKTRLSDQSYFSEFRLNFGNNDLLIGINIDTIDYNNLKAIAVKLYEPLPTNYDIKSTLSIVEAVSDSVAYEVDSITTLPPNTANTLRPANFNLEIADEHVIPTQYFSYTDLFSYPVNNTNNQIYSLFNEKGVELSIDHSDYANFIHFSSAQERLMNFKYKLQLIESYSSSLAQIYNSTSQSVGITGSVSYYEGLTQGVVSNFDHYERFLYYESSSTAWPKTNTASPYVNAVSTSPTALNWYVNQLTEATKFDGSNYNALINTIPAFLRDDPDNDNYLIFVHMIGQHFDNLWLYSKAVTDKYDGDNRLDFGISKDLVGEALKNFGVKLYTSNNSIEDLFGSFIGQSYQSGSEVINNYITGSLTGSNTPIQPSSYDNYNKEVQKRIYHNLSHLVKTKGTERGLRALINCFGIPSDILKIKLYGGRSVNERPFFGDYQYYTSSLDKIRLDNTGSIVTGSTLSSYTSIIKRDDKYTDDLHAIEVGFSPVDNIDNYILANITASFNIDDYIGDPGDLTSGSYSGLATIAQAALSGSQVSGSYDYQDYVRLIKFYDNTIFKMIRDFIPARVVADTGIIIKPNLLNRSKAKSVTISGSRPEYTGSIDTAFAEGSNAGAFQISTGESSTSYYEDIQTPTGLVYTGLLHSSEQPRYNGEFLGSEITATNGNLTANNPYLVTTVGAHTYNVAFVSASNEVCLLATSSIRYITSQTTTYNASDFFNFTPENAIYSASDDITSPTYTQIQFPHQFTGYGQYEDFYLWAQNPNYTIGECTQSIQLRYGVCELATTPNTLQDVEYYTVDNPQTYVVSSWFSANPNQGIGTAGFLPLQYTASWDDGASVVGITDPGNYGFTQPIGTVVTITCVDPNLGDLCKLSTNVTVNETGLGLMPSIKMFKYSARVNHYPWTVIPRFLDWIPTTTQFGGLQSYFTPSIYPPNSSLPGGVTTRYTVYALRHKDTGVSSPSTPWTLTLELSNISPYTNPPSFITPGSELNAAGWENYLSNAAPTPPYTVGAPPYPIGFLTDNTYRPGSAVGSYELKPITQLVRAYVIHAYPLSLPTAVTQAVVYGERGSQGLGNIEGPGSTAVYTDKWILVGWNYPNEGVYGDQPLDQSGIATTPIAAGYGPWVKVPVRSYTTSPPSN